jgi:phage-related protein
MFVVQLPGLAAAGDGIPQSMPAGINAITSGAWPVQVRPTMASWRYHCID